MLKIRVPATSANLGPGFDCLGLALDLWNEVSFKPGEGLSYQVSGEGAEHLNAHPRNFLTSAFAQLYEVCGKRMEGAAISASNSILLSSGLGSSAAAIVAGLFGANEMLGRPLDKHALLKIATDMEGHPDNVAPALLGGLVVSVINGEEIITQRYDVPVFTAVVVKPNVDLPTHTARAVLPDSVARPDAIFNIGRTALVVEAIRCGDLSLLQKVMDDRLHQPYRLKHIPGGSETFEVAKQFGATALSGAGPSIICFVESSRADAASAAMTAAFSAAGVASRSLTLHPSNLGCHLVEATSGI